MESQITPGAPSHSKHPIADQEPIYKTPLKTLIRSMDREIRRIPDRILLTLRPGPEQSGASDQSV